MKEFYLTTVLRRELQGRNISALAKELGIPPTCIHDWVHGRRMPSLKNIHHVKKLAMHLELDFELLLLGPSEDRQEREDRNKVIARLVFDDDGREYNVNISRNNSKKGQKK